MTAYTRKQGQYLAFIYNYTKINGLASSGSGYAALLQNLTADRALNGGAVGAARIHPQSGLAGASIRVVLPPEQLPNLE